MPQQYYQEPPEAQEMDYEEIEHEHRRSGRHKQYGSSGGRLPTMDYEYEGSDECECSCSHCKNTGKPPKSCCRETCFSCSQMQNQQGQGGLVFVPYPYPLMFSNLFNSTNTTTTTTTTAKPTTKKPECSDKDGNGGGISSAEREFIGRSSNLNRQRKNSADIINDLILRSPYNLKSDKKYMLTSMRKTKPTWEPKYGIVPIPDNLAEKLMSQLRQVRELKARRF